MGIGTRRSFMFLPLSRGTEIRYVVLKTQLENGLRMRMRLKILSNLNTNSYLRLNFLTLDGHWRWRNSLVPFCQMRIGPF